MEIDSVLSSASKDKNIEIDQVIDACTPLHKQVVLVLKVFENIIS